MLFPTTNLTADGTKRSHHDATPAGDDDAIPEG
jgi:hypothetical protein